MTLDKKLQQYVENFFCEPNSSIYHYTNSLDQILASSSLKLSSHVFLNIKDPSNNELNSALKIIKEIFEKYQKKNLLRLKKYINSLEMWTVSFSGKNNKACLNKYGKQCIEFNKEFLKKNQGNHLFSMVNYDSSRHKKCLYTMYDIFESYNQESLAPLMLWYTIVIPLLKSEGYEEEESRVVRAQIFCPRGTLVVKCEKDIQFSNQDYRVIRR